MNFFAVIRSVFIFLPITLLIYHLLRRREHKYTFLLLASWLFYMLWSPKFVWVIILTSIVDFAAGLLIEGASTPILKKRWLTLSILTNLGLLGFFKYTGFLLDNSFALARFFGFEVSDRTLEIVLPLGISFHTFQGISYTLDVYRGKIRAVRSFIDFALFVAFFPQLMAGPIVRAVEFLPQMVTPPRVTSTQVLEGMHWFLLGLCKKGFIADWLAKYVDPVFSHPELYDSATHRWAVIAYAAQIYCDFSGYSDMAIGLAKWFGFELPVNFHFPYLSESITDFWKRWHISLSTWMRDYLYISLGGSRRGSMRTHLNLLATMTLCGFWHGASWNYVMWGAYNGVLLVLHRIYDRLLADWEWAVRLRRTPAFRVVAVLATFLLVSVGLVMVRSQTWAGCWLVERSLVGLSYEASTYWVPTQVPLLVGLVVLGHLFSGLRDVRCGVLELPSFLRAASYVTAVILVVVFGPGTTKAFIYFQF